MQAYLLLRFSLTGAVIAWWKAPWCCKGECKTMQQRSWFQGPDYKWCFFSKSLLFTHCPLSQIGTSPLPLPSSPTLTPPTCSSCKDVCPPAVWLWVFWLSLNVDQTPVSNTGQVTPSRLAFCFLFFFLFPLLVEFCFPFRCACILCTLDLPVRIGADRFRGGAFFQKSATNMLIIFVVV